MAALLERAFVLRPVRNDTAVIRSLAEMTSDAVAANFARQRNTYERFWDGRTVRRIEFEDLISPDRSERLLEELAAETGLVRGPFIANPDRDDTFAVLRMKLATRLMGRRIRRCNTTIRFART